MAAPFITAKNAVVGKLETTWGTAETLTSTEFDARIRDVTISPEIESYILEYASGKHSTAGAVMGKRMATIGFKIDMNLGAAAATAPKWGKFFQACGASQTVVSTTSVDWAPDATSITLGFYLTPTSGNAVFLLVKGAMGNCKVVMDELGQPIVADFEFKGCFVSVTSAASALTLTSPDTSIPPATVGSVITLASIAQRIARFELDFGNDVQLKYDPADSTGYLAAYIAKREPRLRMDPQIELLSSDPVYTRWSAGTQSAFSFATAAVGGLKWTITAPKAQLLTNGLGDRNGEGVWDQEYLLATDAGNDEWKIRQSA